MFLDLFSHALKYSYFFQNCQIEAASRYSSFLETTLNIDSEAHFVRLVVTPLRFCADPDRGATTTRL